MADLARIAEHRTTLSGYDFELLADVPIVYHCHHFNLFWDQTIDDALGAQLGTVVRTRAAREAFYDVIARVLELLAVEGEKEQRAFAEALFATLGHGTLRMGVRGNSGLAEGTHLHHGTCWREKYGGKMNRRRPADAVTAGYAAAAMEVVHGLPRESVDAAEETCVVLDAPTCRFALRPMDQAPLMRPVLREHVERTRLASLSSVEETAVATLAERLRNHASKLSADLDGRLRAFGLYFALTPTTYYNRAAYDASRHVARIAPQSVSVMKALLREAAHVGTFNAFGHILMSPQWETQGGPLRGEVEEIVIGACAIGRAMGLGRWCIEEIVPHQRLVLRLPATYESCYYVNREGRATEGACYFMQGAALATMQLAHRVPWTSRPSLSGDFYDRLLEGGLPWRVEETRCVSKGDPFCELVVSSTESANRRLTL
ncbi:MAG: hypothetical protein RIT81_12760 [Deltaproteobacteria bacterium]